MWPFDHPFGTYGWPGPFGWIAHNTTANLAASAIAFTCGYLVKGRKILRDLHTKLDLQHLSVHTKLDLQTADLVGKLDAQHAVQMNAHHVTHDAVSAPPPPTPTK